MTSTAAPTAPASPAATRRRAAPAFGALLREWRRRRALSQLQLSGDSGISQRHLSFLESGRAHPSREMVLRLGHVLEVPLRQRNLMLTSAGFAPVYRERELGDPDLRLVKQAIDLMLRKQEPYPAVVVDRLWNLVMTNQAASRLIGWLLGPPEGHDPALAGNRNLYRMMLHPRGLRPMIENWREVAADLLHWMQREALDEGPDGEARALLDELLGYEGMDGVRPAPESATRTTPFLAIALVRGDVRLQLFTTITTLGTPHDVTLHELRIESFFPADEATDRWLRAQAG
jgi:transcriptional regulator with XRE-family HTH domain